MDKESLLLNRLNAIGQSLAKRDGALALIGLGSVGLELDRLDQYSDLDFFAIVKDGTKQQYLEDLSWLNEIAPVAYVFLNTRDGYKLLYEDGVFCEFAVFEAEELSNIPFAEGRVIWRADGVAESIGTPIHPGFSGESHPIEWHVGEALTNLYVGLARDLRGEQLSATHFIQWYAVSRVVELAAHIEEAEDVYPDQFMPERRFEARFPNLTNILPDLMQGYGNNCESALAILAFLERHFEVNQAMANEIRQLCHLAQAGNEK